MDILIKHNLIKPSQHGFLKAKSCLTNLEWVATRICTRAYFMFGINQWFRGRGNRKILKFADDTKLPQGQPSMQIQRDTLNTPPPPILPTEVSAVIKRLKRNKAPGNDNITADVLKYGGEPIIQMFTNMFKRCLSEGKLPNSWKNASVILIHKKGDTADITNYRPISLLPITYKVLSQVILRRMLRTLDQHQPREQAGFRSGCSTIDRIQVISQLQEKADEYNIPLCFAFVEYEKAINSTLYLGH